LIEKLPPFIFRVAVIVNLTAAQIAVIESQTRFDLWQLHGDESPDEVRGLRPRRILKVFALPGPNARELPQWEYAPELYDADAFLLDKLSPKRGGTGETVDWTLARDFRQRASKPCVLSGGLNSNNVEQAVEIVQPYGVDACSGVESEPGRKDRVKLAAFLKLCRNYR
jgi:phosphoribosylanthranilate isomerase